MKFRSIDVSNQFKCKPVWTNSNILTHSLTTGVDSADKAQTNEDLINSLNSNLSSKRDPKIKPTNTVSSPISSNIESIWDD